MTRFRFKLKGGYVIGALDLPTDVGSVSVCAVGGSKADALHKAAIVAERISSDPVMSAILPPQAQAGIAAAKALSLAAKRGPGALKKLWGEIKGDGKRRLAAALEKEAVSDLHELRAKAGRVKLPNRGRWQRWHDPYYDVDDEYEGAEAYDEDYDEVEFDDLADVEGRRFGTFGRRRRRRRRRPDDAPIDDDVPPDAPVDEPPAPTDDPDPFGGGGGQ